MTQVMVDLETMGNTFYVPIIAIGAVKFDPEAHEILGNSFYTRVDLQSSVECGLEMDASTVLWWMGQSENARREILKESPPAVHIKQALRDFVEWYGPERLPVWGNGAASDNVWMKAAFEKTGVECPWTHREDRCYRTIRQLRPDLETPFTGIPHYALHDAIHQAKHLMNVLDTLPKDCGLR